MTMSVAALKSPIAGSTRASRVAEMKAHISRVGLKTAAGQAHVSELTAQKLGVGGLADYLA